MDESFTRWSVVKFLWCWITHGKHRHRTGERDIYRVCIVYEIRCYKCGVEDRDTVWVLPK
jgi:hypothetical protein